MMVTFKSDVSKRKRLFTPESFAHPAKMHLGMLLWILGKYTKPGETILDPMAGAGSTMLAARYGRNVVLVELEQKFVDMAGANWEKIKTLPKTKYGLGDCQIFQGDARNLTGILADKCIFSAPYPASGFGKSNTNSGNVVNLNQQVVSRNRPDNIGKGQKARQIKYADQSESNIGNLPYGQIDKIITSPPYSGGIDNRDRSVEPFYDEAREKKFAGGSRSSIMKPYSKKENNIGNLPYGQIDKIISSPPFQEAEIKRSGQEDSRKNYSYGSKLKMSSEHPDNISRLAENNYGQIDKIVTSPPYEEAMGEKHHSPRADKLAEEKSNPTTYTDKVDAVISSPPYENQIHKGTGEWSQSPEGRLLGGEQSAGGKLLGVPQGEDYIKSKENIGNLKSDSYLSAMLQVYAQCYEVLKPGGLMILVTKDFIRNKQRIFLSIDTIKLCEQVGFVLEDWHERKLTQQSFWRIIYYQRCQHTVKGKCDLGLACFKEGKQRLLCPSFWNDTEKLETEDILVFRKPSGEGGIGRNQQQDWSYHPK